MEGLILPGHIDINREWMLLLSTMVTRQFKKQSLLILLIALFSVMAGCKLSFGAKDDSSSSHGQVAPPVFSLPSGTFHSAQSISITSETPKAKIYFTVDGSDPVAGQAGTYMYSVPIPLVAMYPNIAMKSIAKFSGMDNSTLESAEYHLEYDHSDALPQLPEPVISPAGGVFPLDQIQAASTVTITCADSGADIYYYFTDFDGLLPTPFGDPTIPANSDSKTGHPQFNAPYVGLLGTKLYNGPIEIPVQVDRLHYYVKAVAVRNGFRNSPIAKAHFRRAGFPTVETFTQTLEKSAVDVTQNLTLIVQDDTNVDDKGIHIIRLSVRVLGHGTTNPWDDPEMLYFEYLPAAPTIFKVCSKEVVTTYTFGTGSPAVLDYYKVDPAACSCVIDLDTAGAPRRITLNYNLTPKANAFDADAADIWKNNKSMWCWIGDDLISGSTSKHTNNPVTELGRWELTQ